MGKSKLLPNLKKMQVFIKTLTGTTITIDISTDFTISDIKAQIAAETGIQFNQQKLIVGGKVFDEESDISELTEGSTVDLIVNMAGGATSTMDPAIVELSKKYNHDKKICRKCYATLPPRAKKCRKRSCGHWPDIRFRKAIKGGK